MMFLLFRFFGVRLDTISREEAALAFMEREVIFSFRPVVVELEREAPSTAPSNRPIPPQRNLRASRSARQPGLQHEADEIVGVSG